VILREILFIAVALFGSFALVATYLWLFHSQVNLKELGSTGAAMAFGAYAGRIWGRKERHG
jgi:uncharacterized membrane protein YfcA